MRLDRGELGRLVLERIQPVQVAEDELERREPAPAGSSPMPSMIRACGTLALAQHVPGADAGDDEGGGEKGGGTMWAKR